MSQKSICQKKVHKEQKCEEKASLDIVEAILATPQLVLVLKPPKGLAVGRFGKEQ